MALKGACLSPLLYFVHKQLSECRFFIQCTDDAALVGFVRSETPSVEGFGRLMSKRREVVTDFVKKITMKNYKNGEQTERIHTYCSKEMK